MSTLIFEGARIVFRNFAGRETEYNRAGKRNFTIEIDEATANDLMEQGYNIRTLVDREDPNRVTYILEIKINFDSARPPKICMVAPNNRITDLTEGTISLLDNADINYADIEVNPYAWNTNGKSGTAAYLKTLYAVIEEDRFASKYATEEYPGEGPEEELPI